MKKKLITSGILCAAIGAIVYTAETAKAKKNRRTVLAENCY